MLLAFGASALLAQTDRATLRGTVTDPSGSVVPNAQVLIQEVGTNVERKLATDENGNYEAPALKPGHYLIKVEITGFRGFLAEDVLLDAGLTRRFDIALQVGATTESVTVTGGASLIQTENGAISGELDKKKFLDRPLVDVYPSPLALMTTMPGIQGNGWNLVMSGVTDRNKQTWAMDGVANDTTGDQLDNPAFFETVQVNEVSSGTELTRATSFNMISKRGANDWHASAYYKHENSGLNATETFNRASGLKKAPYILHEADADLTGPIIKNRTFFYAAWIHQVIPLGSFTLRNTPTLQMRNGDFSQFTTAIKDPFNNNLPFPNQQIPASRFSSVGQKVMDLYYPKPNLGGPNTFTNNYGWYFPYNSDLYKGDWPFIRVDQKISDKNNLYVRWMRRKTPYIRPGSGFEWSTYTQARDHRQTVVSDTHVFSPSVVNIFTFGHQTDYFIYGEEEKGVQPLTGADAVKAIGLQGTNAKGYQAMGFPQMTVNGLSTLVNSTGAIDNVNANDGVNTFTDTLTWSKGKHVLKIGGEFRHYWWFSGSLSNDVYGTFNFNGSIAGNGFAELLLGVPYTATRLDPLVNRLNHDKQLGTFITDTFKVTPKLTLDFGLRWDYYGIATYDDGLMYNFDLTTGKVVVPQDALSKVNPLYPKNIPITTGQVVPNVPWHNIHPRISAAYRLTDKTVVRGGYGEYTDSWSYTARRPGASPFQLSESYTNVISSTGPLFTFPNPFPTSLSSATVPSQSVTVLPLDTKIGTIRQINFTIERQIGEKLGLRLSYIGMRNTGLAYGTYNMDKPQPSTATFTQSMRPYNLFTAVNVFGDDGKVNYNSLQAEIQKRMGSFTFNSNFTWSKNMYNWANQENPYAITDKWARDSANRDRYWVTSFTWALPFGKQQRFLASAPGIVDAVLGGWTTQFISTFASPTYVSPSFSGSDPSGTQTSGGLPDAIASPYSGLDRTINKWFNAAAFAVPPKGRFGNASPNSLEGFGIAVQHLSVAKGFRITERFRATLTGAFSNLFNHPHFASINTNISNPNPGMFTGTRPNYEPEKTSYRQVDVKLRLQF
ncbi:MAG: carboxypeptidase regulatory-like domain-containing protein [Acidobacteriia bacterium]|nr:carboxypeptidase regulatory-like domain-containing protein [Terriglobia bacterium]